MSAVNLKLELDEEESWLDVYQLDETAVSTPVTSITKCKHVVMAVAKEVCVPLRLLLHCH